LTAECIADLVNDHLVVF